MSYFVFVATPMQRDSIHIAHLIEHCLLHSVNSNEANFFAAFSQIEPYTYGYYSEYECSTSYALQCLLQSIDKNITSDTLNFEQGRINNELAEPAAKKNSLMLYASNCMAVEA